MPDPELDQLVRELNETEVAAEQSQGKIFGLAGLRERVELVGGTLDIYGDADGNRVEITLPAERGSILDRSGAELTRVPRPEDLATLVLELVQQQAAFGQQQAALLQLQTETVRLQRLLIERALEARGSDPAVAPLAGSSIRAVLEPQVTASELVRPDLHDDQVPLASRPVQ